jgi:hypothetical protein
MSAEPNSFLALRLMQVSHASNLMKIVSALNAPQRWAFAHRYKKILASPDCADRTQAREECNELLWASYLFTWIDSDPSLEAKHNRRILMKTLLNTAVLAAALLAGAASVSVTANAATSNLMHSYWIGR